MSGPALRGALLVLLSLTYTAPGNAIRSTLDSAGEKLATAEANIIIKGIKDKYDGTYECSKNYLLEPKPGGEGNTYVTVEKGKYSVVPLLRKPDGNNPWLLVETPEWAGDFFELKGSIAKYVLFDAFNENNYPVMAAASKAWNVGDDTTLWKNWAHASKNKFSNVEFIKSEGESCPVEQTQDSICWRIIPRLRSSPYLDHTGCPWRGLKLPQKDEEDEEAVPPRGRPAPAKRKSEEEEEEADGDERPIYADDDDDDADGSRERPSLREEACDETVAVGKTVVVLEDFQPEDRPRREALTKDQKGAVTEIDGDGIAEIEFKDETVTFVGPREFDKMKVVCP